MRVSVVVPTRDRPDDLARFLATLRAQTRRPDELVVVDAGEASVEDLVRAALSGTDVAVVYLRSAPSTSAQRNLGVERSSGEVLFFLDDDVALEPAYVERTLAAFALRYDPPVGAVMGTCTNPPTRRWVEAGKRLFGLSHDTAGARPRVYVGGDVRWLARPPGPTPVPAVATGRVAYLRAALPPRPFAEFRDGYCPGEDVDLAVRVAAGWTLLQVPDARLWHARSAVARDAFPERAARLVHARCWFAARHRPRTPATAASLLWTQLGTAAWLVAVGARRGAGLSTARGVARGLAAGAAAFRSGSPRGTPPAPDGPRGSR